MGIGVGSDAGSDDLLLAKRLNLSGAGIRVTPSGKVHVANLAIAAGYRHIDTAEACRNESGVGAGIQLALESEQVPRSEIFVTTKLWPGNPVWGQAAKTTETTIASLNESLERLGLDYVDLYLMHAPFDSEQRLAQWCGLVELKRQGKMRAIGVSNFSIQHIEELTAAGLPMPVAHQIELHPWSQKPELVRYIAATGCLGDGRSDQGTVDSTRLANTGLRSRLVHRDTAPMHNSAKIRTTGTGSRVTDHDKSSPE